MYNKKQRGQSTLDMLMLIVIFFSICLSFFIIYQKVSDNRNINNDPKSLPPIETLVKDYKKEA